MKLIAVVLSILILFSNISYCKASEITLENPELIEIKYKEQTKNLKGELFIENLEHAQTIINKQQTADFKDIENLWNATVDNNQVIKFSLQKLAIPEEQRRIHSSLMAKTVSALISGVAMVPSFMGMNYGIQSASYAGARLANNFINKENRDKLKAQPLTDTEAIELATLIEELQNEVVISYYNYKASLKRLKDCRGKLALYNKNYSNALSKDDKLEIAVSSALWDEAVIEEREIIEEVKKHQLMIQRLAGKEAIDNLQLVYYNLDTLNIDPKNLNFETKKIDGNKESEK